MNNYGPLVYIWSSPKLFVIKIVWQMNLQPCMLPVSWNTYKRLSEALFAYTVVYTVYTACKHYSMGNCVGRLAV